LRSIPGRDRGPLSYGIKDDINPDSTPRPLAGPSYLVDASEVYTYITKFVGKNHTVETKVQPHLLLNNDRIEFIALKDHYEGVGVNFIDILKADQILETLYYTDEKKSNMWWAQFEIQMNFAFSA